MKNLVVIIIVMFSTSSVFAQPQDILNKLKEFGVTKETLQKNVKDANAEHYFDYKTTTKAGTNPTQVEIAKFDPTVPVGSRWILVTVDDKSPSKKEIKKFDKIHNTKVKGVDGKIDDNAWSIVKDDADYLVVSFKYLKETLPKKNAFLGDCIGSAYFNKKTNQLEKATFVNEKPLKIKIFHVKKLDMVVLYEVLEGETGYFVKSDNAKMVVDLLGQEVTVTQTEEYTNYKKK